jgi:hypothetical protein
MSHRTHARVALALALAALGGAPLAAVATAAPTAAAGCTLEYQRADTMWAAWGRPDGRLGVESITLQPGQTKAFITDWRYEKQRNDGTTYYGSHLRIATNRGDRPVRLLLRVDAFVSPMTSGIDPAQTAQFRNDLMEVTCPE